jgi:hypothetical protein
LLPELIIPDNLGYPLLADRLVPASVAGRARSTVTDCPPLALSLTGTDQR